VTCLCWQNSPAIAISCDAHNADLKVIETGLQGVDMGIDSATLSALAAVAARNGEGDQAASGASGSFRPAYTPERTLSTCLHTRVDPFDLPTRPSGPFPLCPVGDMTAGKPHSYTNPCGVSAIT
jgi:hypothetical protein